MSETISISVSKRRLAILWFTGGLLLFLLLAVLSFGSRFGDRTEDAWSWFLPTILPTLSLMIGVLVIDATSSESSDGRVGRFIFRLTYGLSLFYLVVVAMTFLTKMFVATPLLDLMTRSNLWLGPLQGLTTAALGAFFVRGARS